MVVRWGTKGRREEKKIRLPIFDGHNDTIQMMYVPEAKKRPFFTETDSGHIDLPRARRAGFCGGLFSIFVPHPDQNGPEAPTGASQERSTIRRRSLKPVDFPYAHRLAKKGIESIFALECESSGEFRVVRTVEEIHTALKNRMRSLR